SFIICRSPRSTLFPYTTLFRSRQWQTLFYERNYSNTKLREESAYVPDFVELSEAMGCESIRVTSEEEILPAIQRAREINDRPVRSEEHTSELQSRFDLVCRLLL